MQSSISPVVKGMHPSAQRCIRAGSNPASSNFGTGPAHDEWDMGTHGGIKDTMDLQDDVPQGRYTHACGDSRKLRENSQHRTIHNKASQKEVADWLIGFTMESAGRQKSAKRGRRGAAGRPQGRHPPKIGWIICVQKYRAFVIYLLNIP